MLIKIPRSRKAKFHVATRQTIYGTFTLCGMRLDAGRVLPPGAVVLDGMLCRACERIESAAATAAALTESATAAVMKSVGTGEAAS